MDAPVDAALGGYPVKVQPTSFGKYRFCVLHELARIGLTESDHLPVVRFQPTAVALHALGPQGTALWARNFLDACGINATLHVARLDLHSDWQGIDIRANDRVNFVTYSDKRALYDVGEEMSGLTFGKRGGSIVCRIYDKSREFQDKGHSGGATYGDPNKTPPERFYESSSSSAAPVSASSRSIPPRTRSKPWQRCGPTRRVSG